MCDDPDCKACSIRGDVDAKAQILAKKIASVLNDFADGDRSGTAGFVAVRALAGMIANVCVHQHGEGKKLMLARAMNDLGDIFNQMASSDADAPEVRIEAVQIRSEDSEDGKKGQTIH